MVMTHNCLVSYTIHEAKTQFSKLIRRVQLGERIEIRRGKELVGQLVPPEGRSERRKFGSCRGQFEVPDDFNAPCPEIEEMFG